MYLIALREHLNRGQTMMDRVIDSMAAAGPDPLRIRTSEES